MTNRTTSPRIYVASLSDYNAGTLHGEWIDADQDIDDVWAAIRRMLAASPENTLCQFCGQPIEGHPFTEGRLCNRPFPGNAEEWADACRIHDYEGFGQLKLGEYESIERVVKLANAISEARDGDAMAAWLSLSDDNEPEDFDEHYRGQWDSFKDYVTGSELGDLFLGISALKALAREVYPPRMTQGYEDMIDRLSSYIDWDSVARDLQSDYTVIEAGSPGYGVWIFEDEV